MKLYTVFYVAEYVSDDYYPMFVVSFDPRALDANQEG